MRYITEKVCFKLNREIFLFKREHYILLPAHIVLYRYTTPYNLELIPHVIFLQKPDGGIYVQFPAVEAEIDVLINGYVIALDLHEMFNDHKSIDFTLKCEEDKSSLNTGSISTPNNVGYPKTTELLSPEAIDVLKKKYTSLVKWHLPRILIQLF